MIGLSEAVRAELRGTGIEVTVVMPGFAKTELASGVPDLRGVPRISPEDIAALTVDALKVPKFDVWAPKRLAGVIWTGAVVPRRMREAVSRAMNSNSVKDTDAAARAAYEARAAQSAPGAGRRARLVASRRGRCASSPKSRRRRRKAVAAAARALPRHGPP